MTLALTFVIYMFLSVCCQYQQKQHSECGTGSTETMWSIDKPTLHVPKKHQGEFARWTVLKRVPPMTDTYLLGHWRLAEGQWEWRWWLEWGTKAGSWFSTLWTIFASPWSLTQRHKASEKKRPTFQNKMCVLFLPQIHQNNISVCCW